MPVINRRSMLAAGAAAAGVAPSAAGAAGASKAWPFLWGTAGAAYQIEGGNVAGGTFSATGAGTLDGVTLASNMTLESGATVTVQNGLTLDDSTINLSSTGLVTSLRFQGSSGATSTFGGTGDVVFDGPSTSDTPRNVDNGSNSHTLVIGPGITIRSASAAKQRRLTARPRCDTRATGCRWPAISPAVPDGM